MTRTKLSNTPADTRVSLEWQLRNVESAMGKHSVDSMEFYYLSNEREYLLEALEHA